MPAILFSLIGLNLLILHSPLLSAQSISFKVLNGLDEVSVLCRVDMVCHAGGVIGLVGRSGIGKSTLLRLLAGLLKPSAGLVKLYPQKDIERTCLYHGQLPQLLPWLSVLQNLQIFLGNERRDAGILGRTVQAMDLRRLLNSYPSRLSGGQIERATLARTLSSLAAVYLLDEPLSGTDYPLRLEIEEFLRAFVAELHCAMVLVTHDVPQAAAISDEIVMLVPGPKGAISISMSIPDSFAKLGPKARRAHPAFGAFVQHVVDRFDGAPA